MRRGSLPTMGVWVMTVSCALAATTRARADPPPKKVMPFCLSPPMTKLLELLDAPMRIEVPVRLDDKHDRPPPSGAPEAWFSRPRGWFGAIALRF